MPWALCKTNGKIRIFIDHRTIVDLKNEQVSHRNGLHRSWSRTSEKIIENESFTFIGRIDARLWRYRTVGLISAFSLSLNGFHFDFQSIVDTWPKNSFARTLQKNWRKMFIWFHSTWKNSCYRMLMPKPWWRRWNTTFTIIVPPLPRSVCSILNRFRISCSIENVFFRANWTIKGIQSNAQPNVHNHTLIEDELISLTPFPSFLSAKKTLKTFLCQCSE